MKNYTWDDIMLENFIKASNGELEFVSVDGKINDETQSAWFAIQDQYVYTMDSETVEMKKYKKVCYKYAIALRNWLLEPVVGNKKDMEVNKLFMEKEKLSNELFNDDVNADWDLLIAKASIGATFRIDSRNIRAKEFFNILKAL